MEDEEESEAAKLEVKINECQKKRNEVNVLKDMQMLVAAARSRYVLFFRVLRFSFRVIFYD